MNYKLQMADANGIYYVKEYDNLDNTYAIALISASTISKKEYENILLYGYHASGDEDANIYITPFNSLNEAEEYIKQVKSNRGMI